MTNYISLNFAAEMFLNLYKNPACFILSSLVGVVKVSFIKCYLQLQNFTSNIEYDNVNIWTFVSVYLYTTV